MSPKREIALVCKVCGAPRFMHASQQRAYCREHLYQYIYQTRKARRARRAAEASARFTGHPAPVAALRELRTARRELLGCLAMLYRQRSGSAVLPNVRLARNARRIAAPDLWMTKKNPARARLMQTTADGSISPQLVRLMLRERTTCAYCTVTLNWHQRSFCPSIDHCIPLARGGRHRVENITVCCVACNEMKGTLTAEEFMAFLRGERGAERKPKVAA
jgi:5-methylcytosine-specific restriction endonuclease McrA